jgi:hypothetical protein
VNDDVDLRRVDLHAQDVRQEGRISAGVVRDGQRFDLGDPLDGADELLDMVHTLAKMASTRDQLTGVDELRALGERCTQLVHGYLTLP